MSQKTVSGIAGDASVNLWPRAVALSLSAASNVEKILSCDSNSSFRTPRKPLAPVQFPGTGYGLASFIVSHSSVDTARA